MKKVYLSHASKDAKVASQLSKALKKEGYEVFNPSLGINITKNWARQVAQAIDESSAMLVLVSPEAMESDMVRNDINYALATDKFAFRVVPVILKRTPEMPWIFEKFSPVKLKSLVRNGKRTMAYSDVLKNLNLRLKGA